MNRPESLPFSIRTRRLWLREFVDADFGVLHALLSCPRVMEFSGSGVLSPSQARERLEGFIASYAAHGFGKWAVVESDSGHVIGYCGVELTVVDGAPVRELGFRFRPECWGRGYATEAGRAVLHRCFTVLGWLEVLAFVEPANVRSTRVLTKLGFQFQRATQWQHLPVHLYRAPAASTPLT